MTADARSPVRHSAASGPSILLRCRAKLTDRRTTRLEPSILQAASQKVTHGIRRARRCVTNPAHRRQNRRGLASGRSVRHFPGADAHRTGGRSRRARPQRLPDRCRPATRRGARSPAVRPPRPRARAACRHPPVVPTRSRSSCAVHVFVASRSAAPARRHERTHAALSCTTARATPPIWHESRPGPRARAPHPRRDAQRASGGRLASRHPARAAPRRQQP